jgi:ferredoxin
MSEEEKRVDEEKQITEETDPNKILVDNLSPRQIIELDACTRCGECVEWCPVYNQDEREGVTPRSKATRFKKILSSQHGLFRAAPAANVISSVPLRLIRLNSGKVFGDRLLMRATGPWIHKRILSRA